MSPASAIAVAESTTTNGTHPSLPKALTGIDGLDDITGGGLPQGRPTLVCGGPGCGKSLFAIEFLVRGATQFGEPGVLMSFEESAAEITQNVRSLGFDLDQLTRDNQLRVDFVHVDRSLIEETGDFDLEALFVRLGFAIDAIGAKRVVLDTVEALFGGFSNAAILRAELRRLFRWLKDRGVTTIITGERGDGTLTRQGLEEYVSDCVILLDHRVNDQVSTRRLRVVKYRGSTHGTNEYPFLIDENGISVLPITSLGLEHHVSAEYVSSGVPALDVMLGGKGYFRGSSVMASGTAGTGKSTLAASFARATCAAGERCLYLSFEESPRQIIRNMRSVGIDLEPFVADGTLEIHSSRPSLLGLEAHLTTIHRRIRVFRPRAVIVDPISSINTAGTLSESRSMVLRIVDYLKSQGITAFFTSLTIAGRALEASEAQISSLIDTWLLLRDIELGGERNRGLYVLKSRGMAHSNQIREFLLGERGIELVEVYTGPEGVLTGSMRAAQESRERAAASGRRLEVERRKRESERRRKVIEAQIAALRAEAEGIDADVSSQGRDEQVVEEALAADRRDMSRRRSRGAGETPTPEARSPAAKSTR